MIQTNTEVIALPRREIIATTLMQLAALPSAGFTVVQVSIIILTDPS